MDQKKQRTHSRAQPHLPQLLSGVCAEAVMTQLASSMFGVSIMVWDASGIILYANDVVARGFYQQSIDDILGHNIAAFTPPEWANERIQVARQAINSAEPITLMEILGGYRLRSHFRPMTDTTSKISTIDGQPRQVVLVTVERITAAEYTAMTTGGISPERILNAEYNDLGRLNVLSNRELEILAHMGQGMRAKEIAKHLFRSVSTIDNHRDNIGEKLGISDRSELIAMAKLAALQPEDAQRQRVQFSKYIPKQPLANDPT